MPDEYLTTEEACELLRLKERRLYDLARQGAIPATRASGRWLFPRLELERWLSGNTTGARIAAALPRPPIVAGSQDPLLEWALRESGCGLAIMAEGSAAGLERFFAGEAMAAGTHLPPAERGNVAAIEARSESAGCVLLAWARRRQGLVLPSGNPRRVRGLADLVGRPMASRQAGAGSQELLLQLWTAASLPAEGPRFAPGIARTQIELGLMVLEGKAEAGLAAEAAAKALKLDFLPLAEERFDLLVTRRDFFEAPIQNLFAFAGSPAFAAKAADLGGYDVSELGQVRWNAA